MPKPIIIAGNWKMYKTIEESTQFIEKLIPQIKNAKPMIFIAPSFTAINASSVAAKKTKIKIGAQNMSDVEEGALTGEISARMIKEAGAEFVILGHSERRVHFKESDTLIHNKIKRAILVELIPILCIGESETERINGRSEEVLKKQLNGCLEGLAKEQLQDLIIAYEPVWAIGTGKVATPAIAEQTHQFIRNYIANEWSPDLADHLPILYGGSVKPTNIESLLNQPNIDGALIGGASLDVESFSKMVNQ